MNGKSRESERPAQSRDLIPAESTPPASAAGPVGAAGATTPPRAARSRSRARVALFVALAADAMQIALLPLVLGGALSPVNDAIDVITAVAVTALIGWHWAFLPTFIAEILPFVDLVPSWTLAVLIATRGRSPKLTGS